MNTHKPLVTSQRTCQAQLINFIDFGLDLKELITCDFGLDLKELITFRKF